ncbi:MAG TPA: tautomerase family protein [Burkholderiaceae bacterium]|nr:tautomerase family protein [Burkholderiaceae bacterium]
MPTYSVFAPAGQLTPTRKSAIAREVTRAHSEVTGAQAFFAQVVFHELQPGSWFVGGKPLEGNQVYLCGHVRGGRPAEMKRRLVLRLRDVLVDCAEVKRTEVWVYLVELPPAHMVEFGHVLPEPGAESAWLDDMPAEDRAMLEALGRG